MSIIIIKSETSEVLPVCRGCLATDRKLYSLYDEKLSNAYTSLIETDILLAPYNNLPQYICNHCSILLLKYMKFRDRCCSARDVLIGAKSNITTDSSISQNNYKIQYKQTDTKILSIYENTVRFDNLTVQKCNIDDNVNYDVHVKFEPAILSDDNDIKSLTLDAVDDRNCKSNLDDDDNSYVHIKYEPSLSSHVHVDNRDYKSNIDDNDSCDNNVKYDSPLSSDVHDIKSLTLDKVDDKEIKATKDYKSNNLNKINQKNKTLNHKTDENSHNLSHSNHKNKKVAANLKTKKTNSKKGKYFETKENIDNFEKDYCVDIIVLTKDQQLKDVLDRKLSLKYLHSPYKCELCYKGFMDEEILNKHITAQHDTSRGNVICEFCQFRYKDKKGLTQHLKSHRLKFSCKQCKYISRTTFNAKEHYKTHSGRVHECKLCGKSYEKLTSHLTHMRIHHSSECVWCDICGEAFIGQFGLNFHKKIVHRDLSLTENCPSCNTSFVSIDALRNHSQQLRNNSQQLRDTACRVACVHCGEGFDERTQLREHLLAAHRSMKTYPCEKCDKTFNHEATYYAHYRRIHVDSEEIAAKKRAKPWVCETCGKTLPKKSNLLYHQRNHTGEKPYACSQCPKSFTMSKLLQSHLKVHTTERPFACKLCPKTFKRLPALRSHEHVHSEGEIQPSRNRRISAQTL